VSVEIKIVGGDCAEKGGELTSQTMTVSPTAISRAVDQTILEAGQRYSRSWRESRVQSVKPFREKDRRPGRTLILLCAHCLISRSASGSGRCTPAGFLMDI
jgi:hypothetical protein